MQRAAENIADRPMWEREARVHREAAELQRRAAELQAHHRREAAAARAEEG